MSDNTLKACVTSFSGDELAGRSRWAVWAELVKARLTFLVLLTTVSGFYMGSSGAIRMGLLLHATLGVAFLAGGAAILNQWLERDCDARMRRTQDRPLPSGQVNPRTAWWTGLICSLVGLLYLVSLVGFLTAFLGLLTLVTYLFVYTPLKRVTPLNTLVGAIPGALPPMIGWSAAQRGLDPAAWSLFAILAFWQLPHFLAIAWMYRDDYARGGFAMLPVLDPHGRRTSRQALLYSVALFGVSLLPYALGLAGETYLVGSILLGAVFLSKAVLFWRDASDQRARQLFYASILYLPLLLGLMALAKAGSP